MAILILVCPNLKYFRVQLFFDGLLPWRMFQNIFNIFRATLTEYWFTWETWNNMAPCEWPAESNNDQTLWIGHHRDWQYWFFSFLLPHHGTSSAAFEVHTSALQILRNLMSWGRFTFLLRWIVLSSLILTLIHGFSFVILWSLNYNI